MSNLTDAKRRRFLQSAGIGAAGLAATGPKLRRRQCQVSVAIPTGPIRQVHADVLDIGSFETGPSDGQVVLLLHGYPYDIHGYVEVGPILAAHESDPTNRRCRLCDANHAAEGFPPAILIPTKLVA